MAPASAVMASMTAVVLHVFVQAIFIEVCEVDGDVGVDVDVGVRSRWGRR